MLNYDKLIISSSAYNILSLDCKSKRLSHAYLFVSKDENLLKRFSESVAKLFINLEDKSNEEKNNLRIDKGIHPDVKYFGLDKVINAEMTDSIVEQSVYSPFESDKKVFVLWNVRRSAHRPRVLRALESEVGGGFLVHLLGGMPYALLSVRYVSDDNKAGKDRFFKLGKIHRLYVGLGDLRSCDEPVS